MIYYEALDVLERSIERKFATELRCWKCNAHAGITSLSVPKATRRYMKGRNVDIKESFPTLSTPYISEFCFLFLG